MKKLVLGGAAAVIAAVAALMFMFSPPPSDPAASSGPCIVPAGNTAPLPAKDAQVRNFRTIIARGNAMGVPARGVQIALAVTLVEANALNLASERVPESKNYPNDGVAPGDHLSINLFQQQVGMGWFDTVANGMKVEVATDAFFGALLNVNGWQVMSFSGAAQAVQRSAFPSRYGAKEAEAVAIYQRYSGGAAIVPAVDTGSAVCPDPGTIVGPASVSGRWANPLAPAPYTLTSAFGPRIDPVLGIPKPHKGQDLGAPTGTPVRSVCDGVVKAAGWDAWGGGNMTTLDCGGGVIIKLMHQSQIGVKVAQKVQAGEVIGEVGSTGNSTGSHLHEQVEFNGTPINPIPFMRDRGVPL